MHKFAVTFTYSADNFVSFFPSFKYFHGHIARIVNMFVTSLRGIVGVNAKQVAAKQHHYTTDNHYGIDVRSRVSNQPEKLILTNNYM